ncbi:hypothetical protein GCM10009750_14270 [Agromyces salentinus]|uniref:Uncharacterized protein n=1 Tax=Agromyces salentinus TaxID=269421 RepID=A0ABN2MM47_9MICO
MIGRVPHLSSEGTRWACRDRLESQMPRSSTPTAPHREFFQAIGLQETVELACTCSRGVDHWYSRPGGPIAPTGERPTRERSGAGPRTDTGAVSAPPRRSPAPAARAS